MCFSMKFQDPICKKLRGRKILARMFLKRACGENGEHGVRIKSLINGFQRVYYISTDVFAANA
jgi:hypothetical protein